MENNNTSKLETETMKTKKPLLIEIRFTDHNYTATVHELKQLERFLSNCTREGKRFVFGSIFDYGDINLDQLCRVMNSIRHYGGYGHNRKFQDAV